MINIIEHPEKKNAPLSQQQQFDDFRRRHSKQNKEIITDNINRKAQMTGMQAEIDALQLELLEVRQANMAIQAHLRKMQRQDANARSQAVKDAINQVLAIVPALQQLQQSLPQGGSTAAVPGLPRVDQPNFLRNMGMTIATRPAAQFSQTVGLAPLNEIGELEIEDRLRFDVITQRRKSKGRRSGTGSRPGSRSPVPKGLRDVLDPPLDDVSSPSSSSSSPVAPLSPAPVKHDKKAKRRRESGLLRPVNEAKTPERTTEAAADTSQWDEGEVVQLTPEDAAVMLGSEDAASSGVGLATRNAVEHADAPQTAAQMTVDADLAQREFADGAEDEGRVRRARRSVNYKEPNLHKKMRKPDGVSVEETLRGSSRASMSAHTVSGLLSPPLSSRSESPEPNTDMPLSLSQALQGSIPQRSAKYAPRMDAMRRKSVLPKFVAPVTEEDDDDDTVDDVLGVVIEDDDEPEPFTLSNAGPSTTAQSTEQVPVSRPEPLPTNPASASGENKRATTQLATSATRSSPKKAFTAQPTRKSPRKGPKPLPLGLGAPPIPRSSQLGVGTLPKRASSIAAAASIRDALADLTDNTDRLSLKPAGTGGVKGRSVSAGRMSTSRL